MIKNLTIILVLFSFSLTARVAGDQSWGRNNDCDIGSVQDCVDSDCCPESWIGDGFEDCADQAYGCDLTCYENDEGEEGGDGEEDVDSSIYCDEEDCIFPSNQLAAYYFSSITLEGESLTPEDEIKAYNPNTNR